MPSIYDFINIPFVWNGRQRSTGLDCFTLAKLVHDSYLPEAPMLYFDSYYELYPTASVAPHNLIQRALRVEAGEPKTTPPEHLDITCLMVGGADGMATVVQEGNTKYLVFMGKTGSRIQTLERMSKYLESVWDSMALC